MSAHRPLLTSSARSTETSISTSSSAIHLPDENRRKRVQYRSCDQCRASKRACDLSSTTLSPCSTCNTRQIKCTTEWLGQKRPKRLHPVSDATPVSPPSPCNDSKIVPDALAEHVKGCKLRIYTNMFEFPFSHWLAPGCNPYFASFDQLETEPIEGQLARCIQLTSGAYDEIKGVSNDLSNLVQQFSVLDALFLRIQLQKRGVAVDDIGDARLRGIRERNKVIDEALIWAAVAHAFQYTVTADFAPSGAQRAQAKSRSRMLTTLAWQKARTALFANVSFNSFRNAFAFIIFGITTPPTMHNAGQSSPFEDTAFAVKHGLRLLQALCHHAKAIIGSAWNGPNHIALQALKVAMWFNDICKAILTPVMTGLLGDAANTTLLFDVHSLTLSDDITLIRHLPLVRSLVGDGVAPDPGLVGASPSDCRTNQVVSDPWTQVINEAQNSLMSLAILSFKFDAFADSDLIELDHELKEAAAYKTLIWKIVADLEADPSSSLSMDVAIAIAKQWQASHALVLDSALTAYDRLEPGSRSMLLFAVHHSSLGLFYLDALMCKVEPDHKQRSLEWQTVDPGNLSSARRVAQICSRARQDALGGLIVTADEAEHGTTRNSAQTLPMGQWCHLFPPLVLQSQAWAAHYLLRQAELQPESTEKCLEWIQLVDDCLFCLDMMQDSLASFPSHALDKMPLAGLLERRAHFPSNSSLLSV